VETGFVVDFQLNDVHDSPGVSIRQVIEAPPGFVTVG
jgi:hypothetical protein